MCPYLVKPFWKKKHLKRNVAKKVHLTSSLLWGSVNLTKRNRPPDRSPSDTPIIGTSLRCYWNIPQVLLEHPSGAISYHLKWASNDPSEVFGITKHSIEPKVTSCPASSVLWGFCCCWAILIWSIWYVICTGPHFCGLEAKAKVRISKWIFGVVSKHSYLCRAHSPVARFHSLYKKKQTTPQSTAMKPSSVFPEALRMTHFMYSGAHSVHLDRALPQARTTQRAAEFLRHKHGWRWICAKAPLKSKLCLKKTLLFVTKIVAFFLNRIFPSSLQQSI